MDEDTTRLVGNGMLVVGLLCFVGGVAMLALGAPVDTSTYTLGALGLILVGAGASMRNRSSVRRGEQS